MKLEMRKKLTKSKQKSLKSPENDFKISKLKNIEKQTFLSKQFWFLKLANI